MTPRVLVVDDEGEARKRLLRLLPEAGGEAAGEAANGLEALEACARLKPDVILLDIEMPEVSGLDVACRLPDPRPVVIFQTAFDEYALAAFEREALDYLLKPVEPERLARALARAAAQLRDRRVARPLTEETVESLEALVTRGRTSPPRRILVRHLQGHRLLPVAGISSFVSEDRLVFAVTADGRAAVDESLDRLERRLGERFLRVSRFALLSIDHVSAFRSNGDGSATVTLGDGTQYRVSRRRCAEVRAALRA